MKFSIALVCLHVVLAKSKKKLGHAPQDISGEAHSATVSEVPRMSPARQCPTNVCPACYMHAPSAPRLYTVQRHDGIGGSLLLSLPAMALAERKGWNYGGALGPGHAVAFNHHNEVWFCAVFGCRQVFLLMLPMLLPGP